MKNTVRRRNEEGVLLDYHPGAVLPPAQPPQAPAPKNDAELIANLARVNLELREELAQEHAPRSNGQEFPPPEAYADEPGASLPKSIEPFAVAALDEISDEVRPQIVQSVLEA